MEAVEKFEHLANELKARIPAFIERASTDENLSDHERQMIARKLLEHETLMISKCVAFPRAAVAKVLKTGIRKIDFVLESGRNCPSCKAPLVWVRNKTLLSREDGGFHWRCPPCDRRQKLEMWKETSQHVWGAYLTFRTKRAQSLSVERGIAVAEAEQIITEKVEPCISHEIAHIVEYELWANPRIEGPTSERLERIREAALNPDPIFKSLTPSWMIHAEELGLKTKQ